MNSSSTWAGEACSWSRSEARIGSTKPMPMNEMTHAKATAQTARGCSKIDFMDACGRAEL